MMGLVRADFVDEHMGIDPGASGAAVVMRFVRPSMQLQVRMFPFKGKTLQEIWTFLDESLARKCYLEKVSAMPKQGVTSTFSFGRNYGNLEAWLVAAGIPFERILSSKWQREFSLPTLKECDGNNTVKKNAHKARAQELFPNLQITHATADALLIAEYCKRKES